VWDGAGLDLLPRPEWPTIPVRGWQTIGPLAHDVKGEHGMMCVRQESRPSGCERRQHRLILAHIATRSADNPALLKGRARQPV
jgi:hypothetical protein